MKYRADIDGIRAIAVMVVILFHYHVAGFSGGYVGVDIFFVLSGYLISTIIFDHFQNDKFSFINFYFRRIRRLFPVYVVVMLATFAVAYATMLPRDFREFGQSLLASTVYVSNVLFYMEAGYFDTASHLKPLLHTWSLSVEEQFYVIFPFVAWVSARCSRRTLFVMFGVLTIISLLAAALYIRTDNIAVFYLYPFRAWEMFFGTMLATRFVPAIKNPSGNNLTAWAGIAMLVVPTVWYDGNTLFPGLSAVLPCFGTVLLIHTGAGEGGWVQRILSMRIPVFLGQISYSLYLWHWPVYVLYVYNKPDIGWSDTATMGATTFVLSVLSWKFVEAPFRYGQVPCSKNTWSVFGSTAVISLVFIAVGLHIHRTNGMPSRLDERTALFAEAAGDLFGDLSGCVSEDNPTLPGIDFCTMGKPLQSESYTLIWGDSHGGAYKRGFESAVDSQEHPALLAWTGGCPPLLGVEKDESVSSKAIDDQCAVRNRAVWELIKSDKRINAVVLVGRWSYYLQGIGVGVDDHNTIAVWPEGKPPEADQSAFIVRQFRYTVQQVASLGIPVYAVEQPPEFSQFQARQLAISLMNGSSDFDQSIARLTVETYAAVLARQGPILEAMAAEAEAGRLTILPTHHFFRKGETCSLMFGDMPTYFDNNHVSSAGAVKIKDMFSPLLQQLNRDAP